MIAAAFVSLVPSIAIAETRLVEVPSRFLLIPPMDAGEKRVTSNSTVFEFPLRWSEAAMPSQQVWVTADRDTRLIKKEQALVRARLVFDSPEFGNASAFCVPREAAPIDDRLGGAFLGKLGMKLLRSQTDGQFCLIDKDNNGSFDHSVLINDGTSEARTPRPIETVGYRVEVGAPVWEGDKVRIIYRGKYRFDLEIVEQDNIRQFDSFTVTLPDGPHSYARQARASKTADGLYALKIPGIDLTVAYDKASQSASVRWPATAKPTIMPVPEDVNYTYRIGY
jgi:hypothetical protein